MNTLIVRLLGWLIATLIGWLIAIKKERKKKGTLSLFFYFKKFLIPLQKQNSMKKLILIVLIAFASCTKQADTNQPQLQQVAEPTAAITSTVKVYAGSNPSVKITYTLTNIGNVQTAKLNNVLDLVVKDGSNFIYDHQGGGNWFANYYFVFNMKDGKQITTPTKIYYY